MAVAVTPGERYHSWLVISEFEPEAGGYARFLCECTCGRRFAVRAKNLLNGGSKQCRPCARKFNNAVKHGAAVNGSKSPEYRAYQNMVQRCGSPTYIGYSRYGGRGIRVFQGWTGPGGFERFLAYVGPRPGRGYSLDRINLDGHYEPENVRWATKATQVRNTSINHWLTVGDRTQCFTDWCRETGVSWQALSRRLERGIPPEIAIRPGKIKEMAWQR